MNSPTDARSRARADVLEAKKGLPAAPAAWYVCPYCGAHQSQEIAPLAICFLCQRSMFDPAPVGR